MALFFKLRFVKYLHFLSMFGFRFMLRVLRFYRGTSTLNILSKKLISKILVENIQRLVRRLICLFTVNLGF